MWPVHRNSSYPCFSEHTMGQFDANADARDGRRGSPHGSQSLRQPGVEAYKENMKAVLKGP